MRKNNISKILLSCTGLFSFIATGCDFNINVGVDNDLILSEACHGSQNIYVELYNTSDKDVKLDGYSLRFYREPDDYSVITLSGTIKGNSTYVIAKNDSTAACTEYADLVTADLRITGYQPIALVKGRLIQDIIGDNKKDPVNYFADACIVRKKEAEFCKPTTNFDEYSWVRYTQYDLSHMGKFDDVISNADLLAGPKLESSQIGGDYLKEVTDANGTKRTLGTGNAVPVTLAACVDGDTSYFKFSNEVKAAIEATGSYSGGTKNNGLRVRYQNINTKESTTRVEEGGVPAKKFVNNLLEKSSSLYVQSIKDGQLFETFGRLIAWVWTDQNTLLNFEVVKAGHSEVSFSAIENMSYKGVTYTNFMYNADLYAQKNKLGLYGQNDPYWDYEHNQPIS